MLKTIRILVSMLTLGGFLAIAANAFAADTQRFDQAQFDADKAAGRSIIVKVSASWCPICKAQGLALKDIVSQPKFKYLTIYEVDYDTQKDALRQLQVQRHSTLIAYKAGNEVARTLGETSSEAISSLAEKAL